MTVPLKSQAVCSSGEPTLNDDEKKNRSTAASFGRGPRFDVGDKKFGKHKISGLLY